MSRSDMYGYSAFDADDNYVGICNGLTEYRYADINDEEYQEL